MALLINKEKVLEDIKEFYFDIAKFFSIILEDNNRFIHHVHKIRGAVETKDIISIDKAFQNAMLAVQSKDRKLLSKLYDMGTRPNKFISGEKLFFNKEVTKITQKFFESQGNINPLLVKPQKGETLHLFTPGEDDYIHNLPIHQDFQYLVSQKTNLHFGYFYQG